MIDNEEKIYEFHWKYQRFEAFFSASHVNATQGFKDVDKNDDIGFKNIGLNRVAETSPVKMKVSKVKKKRR